MDFHQLLHKRYSVRKFQQQPIERELMLQVLEAGRMAPSAVNYQPWHFIVIQDQALKEKLHTVYGRDWFQQAAAYIVVCGDHTASWKRSSDQKDHCDIDIAIAVDHMTLRATELGLGSCWVCNFDNQLTKEILQLPDHIEPMVILPIGYPLPQQEPTPKKRKALNEIVHWDRF